MVRFSRDAALVFLCWFVAVALPVFGKEPATNGARKVVATATATARLQPDTARISFAITSVEVTEKSVREANEKQIKKMKEALGALKLNKVDVKTRVLLSSVDNLLSAQPNAAGARTVERKRARSIFYVTVREKDPEKLRDAVGKLAEAAASHGGKAVDTDETPLRRLRRGIGGFGGRNDAELVPGPTIEWLVSKGSTARRDAVRRAVSDALADAQAAVGNAKLRVTETTVTVTQDQPLANRVRIISVVEDTTLVKIAVQVQITCTY